MKVKTTVKAGKITSNHSQTLVREPAQSPGLPVKTAIKAGGPSGADGGAGAD